MTRIKRKSSESNIYHCVLRGVNKQQIFLDEEDNEVFLRMLAKYKKECGFTLLAYCLMGNHIHILLQAPYGELSKIFIRLGVSFVRWYNEKYERVGHLFQGRFKSEPVESEIAVWKVFRYILRNPVKAGLCKYPEQYAYSCVAEYLEGKQGICDTQYLLSQQSREEWAFFIGAENEDEFIEAEGEIRKRLTDEKAKKMIWDLFGSYCPIVPVIGQRRGFDRKIRTCIGSGMSCRQLSRLTGMPRKVISDALKKA